MAKLDPLFVDALTLWLGSLRARRVTWSLVAVFAVWILLDVFALHFTSGVSRSSYDGMVRSRLLVASPDPRIVIVDIDEASLSRMSKEFGRWPWPRDTLATVLDHLEKEQPAAIVWDILFSDADLLSPGGDKAFDAAVARSTHSHFSVVRLPPANDGASQLTRLQMPTLWSSASSGAGSSTVALIAPVLPAIAASRLGFNNGYPDRDGMLRRYRYGEILADGSQIQSLASSAVGDALPPAMADRLDLGHSSGELMAWRKTSHAYPKVSFADVFAVAEGTAPAAPVPSFKGKTVILGATAASLYDIHPTPLSPIQPGVETLATAIDNALNQRGLAELPKWFQAAFAILMCVAIAVWVQHRGLDSLGPALVVLPTALLAVSYASLNGLPVFLDLHLPAALALLFLGALRYWNGLRHQYWRKPPPVAGRPVMLWPVWADKPWAGAQLESLINLLEEHAPSCRVIVADAAGKARWPELAAYAAIVGEPAALAAAMPALQAGLANVSKVAFGGTSVLERVPDRVGLAGASIAAWAQMQTVTSPATSRIGTTSTKGLSA